MKNFSQFMRHIQLINCRIVIYAGKKLICIAKGGKLKPSFDHKSISEYMEDLKQGRPMKALPMGAYEYDCCVKYLKKIRRILWYSRENFETLILEFSKTDKHQVVITPLEDCLEMVAKDVGFKLTNEEIFGDKYIYTIESVFV